MLFSTHHGVLVAVLAIRLLLGKPFLQDATGDGTVAVAHPWPSEFVPLCQWQIFKFGTFAQPTRGKVTILDLFGDWTRILIQFHRDGRKWWGKDRGSVPCDFHIFFKNVQIIPEGEHGNMQIGPLGQFGPTAGKLIRRPLTTHRLGLILEYTFL